MDRQVTCECGFVVRAGDDDAVVSGIRDHIRSDHPELLERVSDDDIRGWIELVD